MPVVHLRYERQIGKATAKVVERIYDIETLRLRMRQIAEWIQPLSQTLTAIRPDWPSDDRQVVGATTNDSFTSQDERYVCSAWHMGKIEVRYFCELDAFAPQRVSKTNPRRFDPETDPSEWLPEWHEEFAQQQAERQRQRDQESNQ